MYENRRSLPRAVVTDVEFGVATRWIVVVGVTTAHKIRVTPNQLKERNKQKETNKHERTDTKSTRAAWLGGISLRSIIGKASGQVQAQKSVIPTENFCSSEYSRTICGITIK